MNVSLNARLVAVNKKASLAGGVFTVLIGAIVFSGYLLRVPALRSVFPGFSPMNPVTAIVFMIAGASLILLNRSRAGEPVAILGYVGACLVALVGLIKLTGYLGGQDVPIDTFLFSDQLKAVTAATGILVRIAPVISLNFLLLGAALLSSRKEKNASRAQFLAMAAFFMAYLSLLGYLYEANHVTDLATKAPISLISSVTFLVFSLGVLTLRPEWGTARILSSDNPGGQMLRRMLPGILLMVLVFGVIADEAQDRFGIDADLVNSIQDVVETVAFFVMVWWIAKIVERTGAELRSEKEKGEILLESIGDGVVAIDRSWNIITFNKTATAITGWSRQEVMGKPFRDTIRFTREKDGSENIGFIEHVMVTGETTSMQNHTVVTTKDGRRVPVGDSASAVLDENGQVSGAIIVFRDVSKDRQAEEEGAHRNEELKKLVDERTAEIRGILTRFKSVMDHSPVAIFSTDKDGVLTFREGRGGEKAGVKPGQDVGISYFEQFKDVPAHLENVRRALRGETVSDRLTVRKGFFEIVYAPIRNADGAVDGMVGVATDITGQQKAEAEVRELSELKNKFITVVSHQLRTPLSAVRWNLETILAEEMGKVTKAQKEFLRITYVANGEVITRINDFMLALDIEEGRTSVSKSSAALESLWQSVMIDVSKKCELKGLKCSYVAPREDLPAVQADADKIRFVMEKLADNAVQYTTEGTVTAKLSAADGRFRFEINDTGIGIPKAEQPRLFHRFFRASNALHLRTDASGLGLYIAKHYIEGHGGTIGFTSEEGKGSAFWFEIPLA